MCIINNILDSISSVIILNLNLENWKTIQNASEENWKAMQNASQVRQPVSVAPIK